MTLNNKRFLHILTILALCMIHSTTKTMNESQQKTERPIIHVNLCIDVISHRAVYSNKGYFEKINKIGIASSIKDQQKMPLINVIAMDINNKNWVNHPLMIIQEYEIEKNDKKNLNSKSIKKPKLITKLLEKIGKKKFPELLPADLLYNLKTGDVLDLVVHKYPVIATCSNNPHTNLSFEEHFTKHMNNFKMNPNYSADICFNKAEKELIAAGLIKIKHNNKGQTFTRHGKNDFKSIEQLLLDDKKITCMMSYLQSREIGQKYPSIKYNKEELSQEDSGSETDEENPNQCIIS